VPQLEIQSKKRVVQTFPRAIKESGKTPSRDGVVKAIESWKSVDGGLLGPLSFSKENHDGKKSLYIIKMKDGQWQQVSGWVDGR
jgi:branched-chain amino acid transport system substrate-binding protein